MSRGDTWRKLLANEIACVRTGNCHAIAEPQDFEAVNGLTFTEGACLDDDLGHDEGWPFQAWSEDRVYFAKEHDNYPFVESVPRNPQVKPERHK
jgi:hypothetical protein